MLLKKLYYSDINILNMVYESAQFVELNLLMRKSVLKIWAVYSWLLIRLLQVCDVMKTTNSSGPESGYT